jgi:hypothetical protein
MSLQSLVESAQKCGRVGGVEFMGRPCVLGWHGGEMAIREKRSLANTRGLLGMVLMITPLPSNPLYGMLLPRRWLSRCQQHLSDQVGVDDTTSGSP